MGRGPRYVLAALILTPLAVAHAQPAGAQAESLFREGKELMAAGKYAEACTAFAQSEKLDPVVTTLLNLASCREKNGQLATAWGLFLEAERQTRSGDAAAQKLHDVALDRSNKLEKRVSRLTINVSLDSKLDRLEILRGPDRVEDAMWNRSLPIDGGTYTITARAPGAQAWSSQITVATEGDVKTIDVPKLAAATTVVVTPPPPPPPPATAPPGGKAVPLALGVGAVVLVGGAVGFSLWGDSTYSDAKAEMIDQAHRDSLYDSANTKRYVAEGLAVAGIGCAGVAIWMYLHGRHAEAERTATLVVGPSGFAVAGSF